MSLETIDSTTHNNHDYVINTDSGIETSDQYNDTFTSSDSETSVAGHTSDSYASRSIWGIDYVDNDGTVHEVEALGGAISMYDLFITPFIRLFTHPLQHKQQWGLFIAFAVTISIMAGLKLRVIWFWFPLFAFIWLSLSPFSRDPSQFFSGGLTGRAKKEFSFMFLTSASFVAWLFAKSIQNSAALSYSYGLMGGIAYAGYYVGFWATAIVVYKLRSQGYRSFMEAIADRYGYLACISFSLALLYRLFSEIWSNTIVIGTFYSNTTWSLEWWLAVWLATLIPISYVILGGQKSSLLSDLLHGTMIVIFLIIVLSLVIPRMPYNLFSSSITQYTLVGGGDQLCIAIIQGALSYPFMDPAMTDRAFLGNPRAMVAGFLCGGLFAMTFIFLFGFIGTYGKMLTLLPASAGVQHLAGVALKKQIAANANIVTAACIGSVSSVALSVTALIAVADTISTMDSCFMATAKVTGVELYSLIRYRKPLVIFKAKNMNVNIGRICIILLAVGSTLFLLQKNQIALNASNSTGTVVMGLGPAIWLLAFTPIPGGFTGHRPLAFLLPFWCGVIIGCIFQASAINGSTATSSIFRNAGWSIGQGTYKDLLGANVYGACICWGLWFVGYFAWNRGDSHRLKALDRTVDDNGNIVQNNNIQTNQHDIVKQDDINISNNNTQHDIVIDKPTNIDIYTYSVDKELDYTNNSDKDSSLNNNTTSSNHSILNNHNHV